MVVIMENYRKSIAIWLLLLLYLLGESKTSNASLKRNSTNGVKNIFLEEIILERKNNETKFLGAAAIENPKNGNEKIASLINGTSDLVFPNYNSTRDQNLAQSRMVIVSLNDPKDLEDLDHVLAFSEYESQKVNVIKDKRKSQDYFDNDQAKPSKQIKSMETTTFLPYVKTYYNVPHGFQSNIRNSYQERYHPTTVSYQKMLQPLTQTTNPSVTIANSTEILNKKSTIDSKTLYKPENDLTLGPIQVTRSSYYVPTRKIKDEENMKLKKKYHEIDVNVNPKLRKIRKKVKNWNIVTPLVLTTPLSVYNYTVYNRINNKRKSSLDNLKVEPVASEKINNIIYQNDSLAIDSRSNSKRQKSLVDSDNEDGVMKNYNVIVPQPFSYSTKHFEILKDQENIKKPQLKSNINPISTKTNIETKETRISNNSKLYPTNYDKDRINNLNVNKETGYNYKNKIPIIKSINNHNNLQSNINDTPSLKSKLTNKKLIKTNDDVEQSNKKHKNDSEELSKSITESKDDIDSQELSKDDIDNKENSDYNESYEFPETIDKKNNYYNDYVNNKGLDSRQNLDDNKDDRYYETDNLDNVDKDNNYEEVRQEDDQDRSDEDYKEKYNIRGNDQDEDSANNYKVVEKSKDDGGDGGDGGGDGGGGEKKFSKGGEVEQKEDHYDEHGKKEEKGYKSSHEHDKAEKGHHDKIEHKKEYEEKDGEKKEHEDDGKYHEDYYKEEDGKKEAKFDEKGEHKKGHSTKGEHSVHKKDEFEKKTEFFDEFNEDGDSEKDGEYYSEHEAEKGGKEKSGHFNEADEEGKHGKMKKYAEGEYHDVSKGKDDKEGQENHYDHEEKYMKKGAHESGKKWMSKSGDDDSGDNKKN